MLSINNFIIESQKSMYYTNHVYFLSAVCVHIGLYFIKKFGFIVVVVVVV